MKRAAKTQLLDSMPSGRLSVSRLGDEGATVRLRILMFLSWGLDDVKGIGHVNKNIANGRGTRVVVGLVFNGQGDPCHNLGEGTQTLPAGLKPNSKLNWSVQLCSLFLALCPVMSESIDSRRYSPVVPFLGKSCNNAWNMLKPPPSCKEKFSWPGMMSKVSRMCLGQLPQFPKRIRDRRRGASYIIPLHPHTWQLTFLCAIN